MKLNTLQFGKAISAALFVLLLSVVGMKNALAQTQVATLQHADSISAVYYGANAFVSAHNAAVNGDVITLSNGTFNKCDISKGITIRGAGCKYDTLTQMVPTSISGDFHITTNDVGFEGITISGTITASGTNNISFVKCNMNRIRIYDHYNNTNWQFINCIIKNFEDTYSTSSLAFYYFSGMTFINSVVRFINYNHGDVTNPTIFNNSIVLFNNGLQIKNILAYNSIIATVSGHTVSNCTFVNCIGIKTGETSLFAWQTTHNTMEVNNYGEVFESFTGAVSFANIYQLKEEIATTFLGNDETEVGIFGGLMPYNPRPTYMIIRHCNVAPRSTVDGKLSVDVEVLAVDE